MQNQLYLSALIFFLVTQLPNVFKGVTEDMTNIKLYQQINNKGREIPEICMSIEGHAYLKNNVMNESIHKSHTKNKTKMILKRAYHVKKCIFLFFIFHIIHTVRCGADS